MIRLDLATDRLMNISRKGSSQPTISPAGIPDDTVQTSLLVLCDAGFPDDTVQTSVLVLGGSAIPDWKREAQYIFYDGPIELYQNLTP